MGADAGVAAEAPLRAIRRRSCGVWPYALRLRLTRGGLTSPPRNRIRSHRVGHHTFYAIGIQLNLTHGQRPANFD
jgi:hypothetical protein